MKECTNTKLSLFVLSLVVLLLGNAPFSVVTASEHPPTSGLHTRQLRRTVRTRQQQDPTPKNATAIPTNNNATSPDSTSTTPPPPSPPAAASPQNNVTTAPNATSNGDNTTSAATTTETSTMPEECFPVDDTCLTHHLRPLAETAHNTTATTDEKNSALSNFCNTECGRNYTRHITAILQGQCLKPLPPRMSAQERYSSGTTVVVQTPGGYYDNNGTRNVSVPGGGDDHDDNNDNDNDNDEDHDVNENDEQTAWEQFRHDRPGSSLGCVTARDGEYCAGKSGCAFFNSCCYASWVRLGNAAGYMLTMRTIRSIEYLCPGSLRYMDIDGCT